MSPFSFWLTSIVVCEPFHFAWQTPRRDCGWLWRLRVVLLVFREVVGRRIVRPLFHCKRPGDYLPLPPIGERYGDLDLARPDTLRGPHGAVEGVASAALVEDHFDDDGRLAGFLVRELEDGTRMEVLDQPDAPIGCRPEYEQGIARLVLVLRLFGEDTVNLC